MALAEKAYEELKKLPDTMVQEVLDFIGYLESKQERLSSDFTQAQEKSLRNIWDNQEDEIWNEYKPG